MKECEKLGREGVKDGEREREKEYKGFQLSALDPETCRNCSDTKQPCKGMPQASSRRGLEIKAPCDGGIHADKIVRPSVNFKAPTGTAAPTKEPWLPSFPDTARRLRGEKQSKPQPNHFCLLWPGNNQLGRQGHIPVCTPMSYEWAWERKGWHSGRNTCDWRYSKSVSDFFLSTILS